MSKAEISYEEVEGCTSGEVRRREVDELKVFQHIPCKIIFDVKMDLTCKARYIANGSMTDMSVGLYYYSVVFCDSVGITFLVAALNDLDILAK